MNILSKAVAYKKCIFDLVFPFTVIILIFSLNFFDFFKKFSEILLHFKIIMIQCKSNQILFMEVFFNGIQDF